jgi:hypothetical protein
VGVGELVILGLIMSPYLYLIGCEIHEQVTDDGWRKYRITARSTNPNTSEWGHILSGDWGW